MAARPSVKRTAPVDEAARDRLCLALALLVALCAALPLLTAPGIVNTRAGGDSPFLIQRTQQLAENLRAGVWPAHWMPDAAHGLGYPFYIFYASLPYYVAAGLHLAGWGLLWSIKLTQALGFLLAGLAMYRVARRLGARPGAALLASTIYTCAPFHLVNVYVRGDALSEFYALALYPLVLWAATALVERPSAGRVAGLAASYALLAVCHNISVLVFSPLVALWLLVGALAQRDGRWRALGIGAAAIVLGLALSVWFWAPALREQTLVQLQEQTTGYFHYANHFLRGNLVQTRLLHDYTIDAQRTPFSMGLWQAALAVGGLAAALTMLWPRRAQGAVSEQKVDAANAWRRWATWVAMTALAVYTWLMTPSSTWVWAHVPLLPMVQFPWRLLGVQALAIALLAARIPALYRERLWPTLLIVALCVAAGLAGLRLDRLPLSEADVTPERLMLYETWSGNIGSTVRNEYLPRDMQPRPYTSAVQLAGVSKPMPLALEGLLAGAELLSRDAEREEWQIRVDTPALLAFHTTFYPGWEATVDGVPQGVEPLAGLGQVGLRLQRGDHRVVLHFQATPVRRYTLWGSAAALLVLLGLMAWHLRRVHATGGRGWHGVSAAAGALGLLAVAWLVLAPLTRSAETLPGPRVMDFARAPYLHSEPNGVRFGADESGPGLLGYDYGATRIAPGSTVYVTLHWTSAAPGHTATLRWVAATAHLFAPAPVWAEVSAPIDTATLTLALALPADLPSGLYVPMLSVTAEGVEQAASTADGVGMGALGLEPVTVQAYRLATGHEAPLAAFGPENVPPVIALVGARAAMEDGVLALALEWRSERQAPLNYVLSARLRDASGAQVAARDLPPLLGGYPTSLWTPNELVADRVLLTLPDGRALQPDDQVEIVLYDRLTLQAVGTATLRAGDVLE